MAEPQTNTFGRSSACARADAKLNVPTMRLSRIFAFLVSVHRPMMLSPARWMTASKPETVSGARGTAGSHEIWSSAFDGPRTSRTMEHPFVSRDGSRAAPIGPETPLTRILEFIIANCHSTSSRSARTNCGFDSNDLRRRRCAFSVYVRMGSVHGRTGYNP